MSNRAITFDFHNTLAACPEWFDLEVRHLPSAFLRWLSAERGRSFPAPVLAEADSRYRQLRQEIIAHGNELTAEASLEVVFSDMRIDVSGEELADGVEALMRHALAGASPIPGAVASVQALQREGIPLGVVSSAAYHPFLEWTLASFGILDAFSTIITSASAGFYKSRPEIYLHAAEALGTPPHGVVHVGDSLRFDVGGAQRVGMGAVWLQSGQVADPALAIVPDLILESLHNAAPKIAGVLDARLNASADESPRART